MGVNIIYFLNIDLSPNIQLYVPLFGQKQLWSSFCVLQPARVVKLVQSMTTLPLTKVEVDCLQGNNPVQKYYFKNYLKNDTKM